MIIYLLIKTHKITGLKYLCKTIRKDYEKYTGSGIYWKKHLKIHGNFTSTILLRECRSPQELKECGIYYSNLWNIVEERDINGKKTWANLKPEEGDGNSSQYAREMWGDSEYRKKQCESRKISFNSDEYKKKMSLISTNRWKDSTFRKSRKNQSGENNPKYDRTLYIFQHENGTIEEMSSFNLSKKYNLNPKKVRHLINNKRIEYHGWRIQHNWNLFPKNEWTCDVCGKEGKGLGNYEQHKKGSKCNPKMI